MVWRFGHVNRLAIEQENSASRKNQICRGCGDRVGGLATLLNVIFIVPIVGIKKPDAVITLGGGQESAEPSWCVSRVAMRSV
jgi:hypothetical protein